MLEMVVTMHGHIDHDHIITSTTVRKQHDAQHLMACIGLLLTSGWTNILQCSVHIAGVLCPAVLTSCKHACIWSKSALLRLSCLHNISMLIMQKPHTGSNLSMADVSVITDSVACLCLVRITSYSVSFHQSHVKVLSSQEVCSG